jgi:hypothetical protein
MRHRNHTNDKTNKYMKTAIINTLCHKIQQLRWNGQIPFKKKPPMLTKDAFND